MFKGAINNGNAFSIMEPTKVRPILSQISGFSRGEPAVNPFTVHRSVGEDSDDEPPKQRTTIEVEDEAALQEPGPPHP